MTVEENRIYDVELFSIIVDKKVKNLPGFYKLTKSFDGGSIFIINPEATIEELRKSVEKIEKTDERENYSLVKDVGFVVFSSDEGPNITISHNTTKLIVFVPILFSPGYIEKKFPMLFKGRRDRKTVEQLVGITKSLQDLITNPNTGVGKLKVKDVMFDFVTHSQRWTMIIFYIGPYEVRVTIPEGSGKKVTVDVKMKRKR